MACAVARVAARPCARGVGARTGWAGGCTAERSRAAGSGERWRGPARRARTRARGVAAALEWLGFGTRGGEGLPCSVGACGRGGADLARPWRSPGGVLGGEEGKAERAALGSGRAEREGDRARGVGAERERGKEREKENGKEENGKKKRKRKRRGEKKGKRERFAVIPPVATATPVGHARLSRPRPLPGVMHGLRGKQGSGYGCRVFGSSGDLAEQGRFRKTGVRVSRRVLELNDEAEF